METSFWLIHKSWTSPKKRAEWDHDKMQLESVKCPIYNKMHQRGGKRLTDLNVVLPEGDVDDFVWTWQSECMVQDHTLELLRSSGLTGFVVKPVTARFSKSAKAAPRLWELVVTGWAGMAKPESGIHLDESKSCPACGHLCYTGLRHADQLIDESQWDGSDFFMVWPMPRFPFVSKAVVRTVRERGLTGVEILPVAHLKPMDGFAPGRLSYYMPEPRARAIGEPLRIC
jgi:hypothetical protein